MPKHSPKTRVCFNLDGHPKQILSILEREDESLILLLNPASSFENDGNSFMETNEQRYSIHNSENAAGNTIKQTLSAKNGTLVETYQGSNFVEDGGFAFIYSRRLPNLSPEKYTLRSDRKHDRKVTLHEITQASGTPVFAIFVSDQSKNLSPDEVGIFNLKSLEFQRYQIHILWTYIRVPSHHSGCLVHMMTLPRMINKSEEAMPLHAEVDEYARGLSSKEVASLFAYNLELHCKRMVSDVITSHFQNDPIRAREIVLLSRVRSKSP